METAGVITAVLAALFAGGGLGGLINALVARRKSKAETADIITHAAAEVTKILNAQICQMDKRIQELQSQLESAEKRIEELETMCEQFDEVLTGAHVLHDQIVKELHATPKWKPPERRIKNLTK
jgi:peptidoglycan hydrolase CwlO-like protein